jgi:hypothetical protein
MSTPFLKPKLDGARFAGHTVPLDVLKDWAAFEDMIVEVAKGLYLQDHPERQRVPKGFEDGFSLHLKGVEEGSALLDLIRTSQGGPLLHCDDLFDRSKAMVLAVITAASLNAAIPDAFPRTALRHFDRFGRSLREGESVYFAVPGQATPVRFDLGVRKRLVLTTATEYSATRELRGGIAAANHENLSFILKLADETHVTGTYQPNHKELIHTALGEFPNLKVRVKGTVVFDPNDRPKKFESTDTVDYLNPHDLLGRLDDLILMQDGWLDGEGIAPDPNGIRWLADLWPIEMASDLDDPFAYPTPEGDLLLEWSFGRWEVSATIDLQAKTASLVSQHLDHLDQSDELDADLNDAQGWQAFTEFLRTRAAAIQGPA